MSVLGALDQRQSLAEPAFDVSERATCRLCDAPGLAPILSLGGVRVVRFPRPGDPDPPLAPLDLVVCEGCGLAQLRHTVGADSLYREYWYRSGTNATMRAELRDVVRFVESTASGAGGLWVDIGANDGTLFSFVPPTYQRMAFEPAQNVVPAGADLLIRDYFDPLLVGKRAADVVTSVAMFYDVEDPGEFVRGVRDILAPSGVWVNQLGYAPDLVRSLAFDSVCHEHLCYYDLRALLSLYQTNGLRVVRVEWTPSNGGSVRLAAMREDGRAEAGPEVEAFLEAERWLTRAAWREFAARVVSWRGEARRALERVAEGGPVHAYGASTKGNTLLQWLDWPGIQVVADRNPEKHGRQMGYGRIPIVSEETSRSMRPHAYLVLPWAFREEFLAREEAHLARGGRMVFPLPRVEVYP